MNRRDFIRNASALSTLTVLKPGLVFASNNQSAVAIGVIGCGSRARGILNSMAASSNIRVTAVADLFEDKLRAGVEFVNTLNKKKGYGPIDKASMYFGYDAYSRLLDNKEVDTVVIASPGYSHPWMLSDAVAAGKHVYCEKPMAVDAEGCRQIMGTAKDIRGRLSAFDGATLARSSRCNSITFRPGPPSSRTRGCRTTKRVSATTTTSTRYRAAATSTKPFI